MGGRRAGQRSPSEPQGNELARLLPQGCMRSKSGLGALTILLTFHRGTARGGLVQRAAFAGISAFSRGAIQLP